MIAQEKDKHVEHQNMLEFYKNPKLKQILEKKTFEDTKT